MPRFVDRNSTTRKSLGPCECPKTPHTEDYIDIREVLSYADQLYLVDAMAQGNVEALWALFNLRVVDWNLVDERGKKAQLSKAVWQNLDEETAKAIQDAIGDVAREDEAEVPNPSGAPSPN